MGANFSSNFWILKYVHRLNNLWLFKKHNFIAKCLNYLRVRKALKNRMQVMHGMSNFVESLIFWHDQLSFLVFCTFLKERFHLPSRIQKVASSIILFGFKVFNFILLNIELVNNLRHFILHNLKSVGIINFMEHCVPVDPEVFHRLVINLFTEVLHVDRQVKVAVGTLVDWVFPSSNELFR